MSKRIIITLNDLQVEALDRLMQADMETNRSAYMSRFITQETLRRENKKPLGRPKKEEQEELLYPNPDKHATFPMTEAELIGYYQIRGEKMLELPTPLTKEELKAWDL